MPLGRYANDGSGRDCYVNSANAASSRLTGKGREAANALGFWPDPVLELQLRQRERNHTSLSPSRGNESSPPFRLDGSAQLSPNRLSPMKPSTPQMALFATPRRGGRALESSQHRDFREGRFGVPSAAPPFDGRLPAIKKTLHLGVGVRTEFE